MSAPRTLIIATRNAHKTAEIRSIVGADFEVLDVTHFPDLPEIEETGTTFLENATLKAEGISKHATGWVLSDDSGLEVDALGGAPGVWSSSFGGEEGNHAMNNAKLLAEMDGKEDRSARFRCTMVLAKDGKLQASFTGAVEGRIIAKLRGDGGFGYDPLFIPEGYEETFSELGDSVKNALSHRSIALTKALEWLNSKF
ncbi:RdgB/HAM1 family non-canonical purine NTP pyrophosphatase [Luteolibacter pohnpeiensis]|uniref:RdgB/HAM1 family non-canonical purine NTP pyrophosphatase n=1 Tax=Luteolibacter pohnpeiensis TaxID=454153 RepID=UPI002D7E85C0|nr:RdgB/HAM1 family non-canonical purine NTP pyrophosphatase [Luteolibacter pohnpeiensis]